MSLHLKHKKTAGSVYIKDVVSTLNKATCVKGLAVNVGKKISVVELASETLSGEITALDTQPVIPYSIAYKVGI